MWHANVPPLPPPKTTSSGGAEGAGCHKMRKKKKYHVPSISMYEGKCDEIKLHMHDDVPRKNGFDVFAKMATEIGEYIARTVPNAGEFALMM
jgi:hypothetical protein